MPLNFTAPLMPPWPLTPITGNKVYGSPNQAMHQGDRSLTHSPRSLKQPQMGTSWGGSLKEWEGVGGGAGKNRSGAKKPNNGHPKKETGVVLFMFWFEPGRKGWVFFSLCLVGKGGEEGVKSKLYWEHS